MGSTPMGPKDVYTEFNDEHVEAEIKRINAKFVEMNDARVNMKFPTTELILSDYGLTFNQRARVAELFEREGWVSVASRTTAENGERPGLIRYTFSIA